MFVGDHGRAESICLEAEQYSAVLFNDLKEIKKRMESHT